MLQERAEESTENANPSRISRKDYVSLYSDYACQGILINWNLTNYSLLIEKSMNSSGLSS